jgi:hypothetical protein
VTHTGLRVPRKDLAPVIQHLCRTEWKKAGGCEERLYLHLEPLVLDLDRVSLLSEAVKALLTGGLSPQFSPPDGAIGVHLWLLEKREHAAMLLMADSEAELLLSGEPSTAAIEKAKQCAQKAACSLVWQPARGAVWRIYIPLGVADLSGSSVVI